MAQNLLTLLKQSFDLAEFQDLVYELGGIEYDDLPTQSISRAEKMRALIQYCQHNGRLSELLTLCRQQRPETAWPDPGTLGSDAELFGGAEPRLPHEPETVPVPAGGFLMGSAADAPAAEQPRHPVTLPYFRIGRYPVTNEQYARFLLETPAQDPPHPRTGWHGRKPPPNKLDHPVVGITWHDALAYCRWLSAATGKPYRLPTEAEWEKAARGTDGRIYPWGSSWQDGACHAGAADTTAVSTHDATPSPYDAVDLLGNVCEWTTTAWGSDRHAPNFPYPYDPADGREDLTASDQNPRLRRVIRGGAYDSPQDELRCAARGHMRPGSVRANVGFRVLLDTAVS
ncbi:MAG: SUMF1/EgtB/PvdO family nonheme iron enzyme [Anaerolineales bacterium]|nr:SUMF1/EgtB/PvdO family nonheme iron enzyme [Anaerolineales bacterium]